LPFKVEPLNGGFPQEVGSVPVDAPHKTVVRLSPLLSRCRRLRLADFLEPESRNPINQLRRDGRRVRKTDRPLLDLVRVGRDEFGRYAPVD
jgi:hypothetical protein